ncbi:hypothetical protein LSTR_LSTR004119 [Laodelphax striatellus]|uniref:PAS domain-containing protein n=1 Tax=Laodelphax striatellus TaxID=195883 RepID=A0A482WHN1_LAOST|nr:hypothetical protein LSTR_LSTR004119 [Laodelphax striatellus]
MPETRECVVQGATNVFTSIHAMDMKFLHIDKNGEFHLGFPRNELQGISWYQLLHWDCMREAQSKLRLITQSEQDRSCILLLRLQRRAGDWLWVHCVLQVKDNMENSQQPVIVCTNQVLSEREASVMRANSWLYHYYMVQTKLQYGLAYEAHATSRMAAGYYQPPPAASQPYHQEAAPPPVATAYHQMSPLAGHQPALHPHVITHASEPVAFRYSSARRSEPEPVDYSLHPLHLKRETLTKRMNIGLSCRSSTQRSGRPYRTVESQSALVGYHRSKGARYPPPRTQSLRDHHPSNLYFFSHQNVSVPQVPDILHQELSPYVTTTPPTPGSAVSLHNAAASASATAFTFDWAPEQFVPASTAPHSDYHYSRLHYNHRSPTEHDDHCHPTHHPANSSSSSSSSSWSTDASHRNLFPLQPPPAVRPSLIVRLDSTEPMDHQTTHVKGRYEKCWDSDAMIE